MNRPFIIAACTMAMLLVGCSGKLDRSEAKKQLAKCMEADCKDLRKCTFTVRKSWKSDYYQSTDAWCVQPFMSSPNGEELAFLNYCFSKGILAHLRDTENRPCASWTVHRVELPPGSSRYLDKETDDSYTFVTATFEVDEVTGITQQEETGEALAEYRLKGNRTPFGDYFTVNCFKPEKVHKAAFRKFDDGWRMQ